MKEKTKENFLKDLKALLKEYDAELSAEDHFSGYAECGEDVRMAVDLRGIYDENGETVRPYMEIDLGKSIDGK